MQVDGLGHLQADRQRRVERRHRLLEDHGDLVAADGADAGIVELEAGPGPRRSPRPIRSRPGGVGIRRMIESAVTLLPEPDSPTMATVSPGADVEGDVVDGRHPTALGIEARRQVADLQER